MDFRLPHIIRLDEAYPELFNLRLASAGGRDSSCEPHPTKPQGQSRVRWRIISVRFMRGYDAVKADTSSLGGFIESKGIAWFSQGRETAFAFRKEIHRGTEAVGGVTGCAHPNVILGVCSTTGGSWVANGRWLSG